MKRLTELWEEAGIYIANVTKSRDNNGYPALDEEKVDKLIQRLAMYEDLEEQGLLYRKVFYITDCCNYPTDCPFNCNSCQDNHLEVTDMFIPFSDYNPKEHFLTKAEAEEALEKESERK